jgi:glutathione synthase/RimK-type ligase-like ATP-grasp enzyme
MHFLGIKRKSEFSPNHVVSDFMIFEKTAQALEAMGATVSRTDEAELKETDSVPPLIFSMVQGPTGADKLAKIEDRTGALVINSAHAVLNCYRVNMVRLLPAAKVPFPQSRIVDTCDRHEPDFGEATALWIKRGDVHAVHQEDVALAHGPDEALELLQEFRQRGIAQAILQEHLKGATVKFYGVRGGEGEAFFHWFATEGTPVPFDEAKLRKMADDSAQAMGLYVYGGDVIVREDASMVVIDVNDWPSFGPVRDKASEKIARLLHRKGLEHERR